MTKTLVVLFLITGLTISTKAQTIEATVAWLRKVLPNVLPAKMFGSNANNG